MSAALIEHLERTTAHEAERLADICRAVASRLERIADELDRRPLDSLVNELGELQSQGSQIDAGAGRYAATRQALKDARAFAAPSVPAARVGGAAGDAP